jgi:hypothetical protein
MARLRKEVRIIRPINNGHLSCSKEDEHMKRLWAILLSVSFLCALVAVANAQAPTKATPELYKTCSGPIESVTLGNAAKRTNSEIVVADKTHGKITFVVKLTTKIVDAKGAVTTLDKCQKGQDVTVKYKTTAQGNEAVSIKITK